MFKLASIGVAALAIALAFGSITLAASGDNASQAPTARRAAPSTATRAPARRSYRSYSYRPIVRDGYQLRSRNQLWRADRKVNSF